MNICFCTPRLPYPPIAGGRIEIYRLIQGLVERGHEVTLITAGDQSECETMESEVGVKIVSVEHDRSIKPSLYAQNLFVRDPLPIMNYRRGPFFEAVSSQLRKESFDILHLHTLQMTFLAQELETEIPRVIRFTNIKSLIYQQYARHTSNPAKAVYAYLQYLKTKRFERLITGHADVTLTITDEDGQFLNGINALGRIETLPAGIDVASFSDATESGGENQDAEPIVTFFGSMDYHPNEDAIVWFTENVWPKIREANSQVALELVGKSPPEQVEALGDREDITVTGFVEDITEWVQRATVVVIPIRVGTGVRMKILHAMAMGKPIVSTATGMQGIAVEDDVHALIRDEPTDFATGVNHLLEEENRRTELGTNAKKFVAEHYGYDSVAMKLEAVYEEITPEG